ncbi:MAG: GAF domain-containing protein [Anaerolineae bacterium]|nr:GAF domain-containing protein [Anaerolineae bacterium]
MTTTPQSLAKSSDVYEIEIRQLAAEKEALEKELQLYKDAESQSTRFANQLTRFTNQLGTAADVSKQLSSILDIDLLLKEIVTLVQTRFHLYHVHVYLLDEKNDVLHMHVGSGEVGQQLRDIQHKIPLKTKNSLVVKAARSRETILVDDVNKEPSFMPNPLLPDTQSEMAIPLVVGDKVIGVLDVQDDESNRFDQIDVNTFNTFSGHIAAAIQNAYLFAEQREAEDALRRYASRLQSLHQIDKAILTSESPESIAKTAVQLFKSVIDFDLGSVTIFDSQTQKIRFFTAGDRDIDANIKANYNFNTVTNAINQNNGQPICGSIDENTPDKPLENALKQLNIQSFILYPLRYRHKLIGAINLASYKKNAYDQNDIAIVDEIAAPLAIAIQQARFLEEIRQHAKALEARNEELEQFAYVASHDLQEPLRIVVSYVQLLARQYEGQLDEDADIFIKYAIDAALRMRNLISDLLSYSRLDSRGKSFVQTDMNEVLEYVLADLSLAIEENAATITHDPLPIVLADSTQMSQILLNLISNAIKFKGKKNPEIHITASRQQEYWQFSVQDNGIGIEEQYLDRIFAIFQRLHTVEEYPGTGIGLAICKKIVERHNGKIWVESTIGQGTTFFFTLPL